MPLTEEDIANMRVRIPGHGLPAYGLENERGALLVILYLNLPDPELLTPRELKLLELLSETKNFKKR